MNSPVRLTDLKREAIVQAAISEFRSNGFDASCMDKIAARAEVSKRTVYNHFPSKDELFAVILHRLWEGCNQQAEVRYSGTRALREQLFELMQSKVAMLNNACFRDLAQVAISAGLHSPERARQMVARLSEKEESITVWIRAAQADGKLKAVEPCFAAQQLHGLLKTFAFWPQLTMGQPPLSEAQQQQVLDSAVDMFLAYYTAR